MFLDRETPGLRNRGAQVVLQVREVLHEKTIERMPSHERMKGDQHVIGRPDLEDSPHDEAARVDFAVLGVLLEQEPADEKTAQREKQIDAFPAEVRERILRDRHYRGTGIDRAEVIAHHGDDRDAAQKVEFDRARANDGFRPPERVRDHR